MGEKIKIMHINTINKYQTNFYGFKENIKSYQSRINYTYQHRKAYRKVEKELTGKCSFRSYFHDLDKLIMYVIGVPKKLAHNIHVAVSPHHVRNGHVRYPKGAVIDWESARYTKPDKPLSAREYYEKSCPKIPEIEEFFKQFGL